ncbi:hypothetical protein [Alteromonas sp. C1M14]|uniref:hypothetical protein n=1 Tax=Alteromonas sp. C1M14 TaxID=2841567 RepID=UPI001C0910D3|nr:hypothetical protein [Alteromonas sp. C1M14]MBU2976734.1 hypothetical protein [Alteromonas sp. C1M14]
MSDNKLLMLLKIMMFTGISLILLGIWCHTVSDTIASMGVTGIVISACLVAVGMILSLPTKMYITFLLVKMEEEHRKKQEKG